MTEKNQGYYGWIESIRTVAMILVVVSHVADYYVRLEFPDVYPIWYGFISCLITVAVPMFFLLSGYLTAVKRRSTKKQLCQIVIPLIIWTIVYIVLGVAYLDLPAFTLAGVIDILSGYIHLYFLFALIQLHLLFSTIRTTINKNNVYYLLIIYGLMTVAIYSMGDIIAWSENATSDISIQYYESLMIKFGISWGLFYFLGVFFALRPVALNQLCNSTWWFFSLSCISMIVYLVEYYSLLSLHNTVMRKYILLGGLCYQIFGTLFLLSMFRNIPKNKMSSNKILKWLETEGKYTFGIYLIHPAIILCQVQFLKHLSLLPQTASFGFVLCLLPFTWIIAKSITYYIESAITGKILCKRITIDSSN